MSISVSGELIRPAKRNNMTPGQKRRLRRNIVIYCLVTGKGIKFSQRYIADVFQLPRSLVGKIAKNLPEKFDTMVS